MTLDGLDIMRHFPRVGLLTALALAGATGVGRAQETVGQGYVDADAFAYDDSLEARVWLDRGDEPVLQYGDEVRVYYRTSDDAFAAIFRIDTDGRITLVYPQHPDVDPFVVGARDYRLIFPDAARWEVREDPGVGYYFMVASREPLDFSLFGFDDERGWDLSGVGETVYEDPYVAIDDYVAAVLPTWDVTPYALDFLEYNVGEDHDYPRFLCYDCHDDRGYERWDPYASVCTSYQVVIWRDPYFVPRFRYLGTRVVFARPIGPRPRYGVTARIVGSSRGPIIRTRAAPPRRTATFKEAPSRRPTAGSPSRRSSGSPTARSRDPVVTPDRSRTLGRSTAPGRAEAQGARRPSGRLQPPSAGPSRRGKATAAPSARGGSVAPRERPTLQRRRPPPSARGSTPPRARPAPRVAPTRPPRSGEARPPTQARPRAQPSRPPGEKARPRAQPSRPPGEKARPRAQPSRPPGGQARPRAQPSRPPGGQVRPRAQPSRPPGGQARPRAQPSRPPGGQARPRAQPSRPPGGQARPRAQPSRPPGGQVRPTRPGGSAGPSRPPPRSGSAARSPRSGANDARRGSTPPRRRPGGGSE